MKKTYRHPAFRDGAVEEDLRYDAELLEVLKTALEAHGEIRLRASGASMAPLIREGDILAVRPAQASAVRPGDVIAFLDESSSRLVGHRVVRCEAGGFVAQGDRCAESDVLVRPDRILGRVVGVTRGGRRVRAGLGPERRVIVWLTRRGRLFRWVRPLWRLAARLAGKQEALER